jgi:hypothetical protein
MPRTTKRTRRRPAVRPHLCVAAPPSDTFRCRRCPDEPVFAGRPPPPFSSRPRAGALLGLGFRRRAQTQARMQRGTEVLRRRTGRPTQGSMLRVRRRQSRQRREVHPMRRPSLSMPAAAGRPLASGAAGTTSAFRASTPRRAARGVRRAKRAEMAAWFARRKSAPCRATRRPAADAAPKINACPGTRSPLAASAVLPAPTARRLRPSACRTEERAARARPAARAARGPVPTAAAMQTEFVSREARPRRVEPAVRPVRLAAPKQCASPRSASRSATRRPALRGVAL